MERRQNQKRRKKGIGEECENNEKGKMCAGPRERKRERKRKEE